MAVAHAVNFDQSELWCKVAYCACAYIMSSLPAAALGMSTVHHFPRARYLLKLAEEEGAPQIASLLQRQGLHCVVDRSHVVVSADPEKLKSQVRLMLRIFLWDILPAVLEVNVFLSLSLSLLSLG